MKLNKQTIAILEVISSCPAMYSQNKLHKTFEHRDFCIEQGFAPCGSFLKCPKWESRLGCWKALYDHIIGMNTR